MDRRSFLKSSLLGGIALASPPPFNPKTRHLIVIVNGPGTRKKDYYENTTISPNINRIARNGFVFEEDQCPQAALHQRAYNGLIRGVEAATANPSPSLLQYVRGAYGDSATHYWHLRPGIHTNPLDGTALTPREALLLKEFTEAFPGEPSLDRIPTIMAEFKPRILLFQQAGHDAGHDSYEAYLRVVKNTDNSIGKIANWIRNDPYFSTNTALVIRPDFGRDDEPNHLGELHHSQGFYYSERVASIFWGPDFRQGVDRSLVHSVDFCPTLTHLFGVDAPFAQGQVLLPAFV